MIGIVVVSHSAKLAEGVVELAGQMAPDVRLVAAGGTDQADAPLGTNPMRVLAAIEAADTGDGVLVLMDLGSALLSAEMALEMLSTEQQQRVRLCEAPLVEGTVAAAVQARLGATLAQVANEARLALQAKITHLGSAIQAIESQPEEELAHVSATQPLASETFAASSGTGSQQLQLTVQNRLGFHARPAARLVQTVGQFADAHVEMTNLSAGRGPVNARSINGIATLGVRQGHQVLISARGSQAQVALDAILALAKNNYGDGNYVDDDSAVETLSAGSTINGHATSQAGTLALSADDAQMRLEGIPVVAGMAAGAAHIMRHRQSQISNDLVSNPQAEWELFSAALHQARTQLQQTAQKAWQSGNRQGAAIFEAHLLFLQDEMLVLPVRAAIFDQRLNAAAAWQHSVHDMAVMYRTLDDPYLQMRAADVEDVGRQVMAHLLGNNQNLADSDSEEANSHTLPYLLIADDLAPSEVTRLDPQQVLGVCLAEGGSTSHSAILLRNLGIPTVVGLGQKILTVAEGSMVVLDGQHGEVWLQPGAALLQRAKQQVSEARRLQGVARQASVASAVTRDGRRVEVAANIGSVNDAREAIKAGAEGVGLFRTEFLFMDRPQAPSEGEQYDAYRAVAEAMQGRPLIIRTLDIGGDKPLAYLDFGKEANPFLGWRGIRLCLAQPALFKVQLRALVRLAADFPLKLMFPMVTTVEEVAQARQLIAESLLEVKARGQATAESIETGIMVEVPAVALQAARFAASVDFFSIGTNDLTQYTLAAERGNPRVAKLSDAFHPAVLRLIEQVCQAAQAAHKWVGVCGELAGDPLATPILVGLGVDELSMSPPAIAQVKQRIRQLDYQVMQKKVVDLLNAESAQVVRTQAKLLAG